MLDTFFFTDGVAFRVCFFVPRGSQCLRHASFVVVPRHDPRRALNFLPKLWDTTLVCCRIRKCTLGIDWSNHPEPEELVLIRYCRYREIPSTCLVTQQFNHKRASKQHQTQRHPPIALPSTCSSGTPSNRRSCNAGNVCNSIGHSGAKVERPRSLCGVLMGTEIKRSPLQAGTSPNISTEL